MFARFGKPAGGETTVIVRTTLHSLQIRKPTPADLDKSHFMAKPQSDQMFWPKWPDNQRAIGWFWTWASETQYFLKLDRMKTKVFWLQLVVIPCISINYFDSTLRMTAFNHRAGRVWTFGIEAFHKSCSSRDHQKKLHKKAKIPKRLLLVTNTQCCT